MRKLSITGILLLLCLTLANATACNAPSSGEGTENLVKVVQGDLTVTVSGSGNIEVSNEIKLAFGVGGRIDKIYVHEGDKTSKGEVLAKLETSDLELAVTEAKVAQTKAQVAVIQAQADVIQAQTAVIQAEAALQTAKYELNKTRDLYTWEDIKVAQADVDEAERYLEDALWKLGQYSSGGEGYESWQKVVIHAQARLDTAKDKLDAMLSGADPAEVVIKQLQVEAAQQSLELAQQSLEVTQQSPWLAQQSLGLAQQSLEQAQEQLDEATITAPFDSVVAKIYVDEGDIIPSPSVGSMTIIYLIDPSSVQLKVQVDEIDISGVKPGQKAIIEVDALPTIPLEGKVSYISLLPTEEAGVIVYDVEITFDVAEGIGIRAGMSATADILIADRSNVLLVPDRAVKQDSQGNNIVEVMVDGQIEERVVDIGISDGYQTEILTGLKEGEMVLERQAKSQSSKTGLF